jgi:uncharacterized protein (DUF983 family)
VDGWGGVVFGSVVEALLGVVGVGVVCPPCCSGKFFQSVVGVGSAARAPGGCGAAVHADASASATASRAVGRISAR